MENKTISNKEFNRSIAFTFYAEWAQDATNIEEDYGLEGYALFCKAVINYALYEVEIEEAKKPPIKYFWNSIKEKIDASQAHRAKGFSKEDTELSNKIREYKSLNPSASQREIAEVFSCSVGKVNKVLKDSTSTIIPTSTSTITSVNMNVNDHERLQREMENFEWINQKQQEPKPRARRGLEILEEDVEETTEDDSLIIFDEDDEI